jgi:hypothetical protein
LNILFIAVTAVLAVALVALVVRWRAGRQAGREHGPDQIDTITGWEPHATRILTPAECQAFETLRTALPEYIILAQVPLARFIKVPTHNLYAEWLHRAGRLCVDLVVCDGNSRVVAGVEIQPSTPLAARALRRQQRMLRVLKAAHIPVHAWPDTALPGAVLARETILRFVPEAQSKPRLAATIAPLAETAIYVDTIFENDGPPSTWLGDLDTNPAPLGSKAGARASA